MHCAGLRPPAGTWRDAWPLRPHTWACRIWAASESGRHGGPRVGRVVTGAPAEPLVGCVTAELSRWGASEIRAAGLESRKRTGPARADRRPRAATPGSGAGFRIAEHKSGCNKPEPRPRRGGGRLMEFNYGWDRGLGAQLASAVNLAVGDAGHIEHKCSMRGRGRRCMERNKSICNKSCCRRRRGGVLLSATPGWGAVSRPACEGALDGLSESARGRGCFAGTGAGPRRAGAGPP